MRREEREKMRSEREAETKERGQIEVISYETRDEETKGRKKQTRQMSVIRRREERRQVQE